MEKKLRPKYTVYRMGLEEAKGMRSTDPASVDSPFTLMPRKDPAAFAAMVTYARVCEPDLAAEIKAWLQKIAGAPPVFGTQGERNHKHIQLKATRDIVQV